jgi:hypothetical protein
LLAAILGQVAPSEVAAAQRQASILSHFISGVIPQATVNNGLDPVEALHALAEGTIIGLKPAGTPPR